MSVMSQDLRDKLWLYFYIKEDTQATDRIYTSVMKLRDELRSQGMTADFVSKDDAIKFLEKRMPNVLQNLKEYNISNPLPATLYVSVSSDTHYQILKDRISEYSDIITNMDQLSSTQTLQTQEKRVIKTINAANTMVIGSYILISMLLITIISMLISMVTHYVYKHHRILEIKKLLWSSYRSMTLPFLMYGVVLSAGWWLCGVILCVGLIIVAQPVLWELLGRDSISMIREYSVAIAYILAAQLAMLVSLVYLIWYSLVYHQIRKL